MVTKENHKCHFSSKIVSDKLCKFQSYKTCDSIQKKSQNPPRSWDSSSGNDYCQNVLTSSNFQAKYFSLYKEQANMLVWQKEKKNSYTTLLRVLFLVFYFNFHSYSWISKSGQKLKCTGCFLPDSPQSRSILCLIKVQEFLDINLYRGCQSNLHGLTSRNASLSSCPLWMLPIYLVCQVERT